MEQPTDNSQIVTIDNQWTGDNPADVYLSGIKEPGKRTIHAMLNLIASILSEGSLDCHHLNWSKVTYSNSMYVRDQLLKIRFEKNVDGQRIVVGYQPATINLVLSALRGVMKTTWKMGLIESDTYARTSAISGVKSTSDRLAGREVTEEEVQEVLAECRSDRSPAGIRDESILCTFHLGGLRRFELAFLDMNDYTRDSGELIVHGKRGKIRTIFLRGEAKSAMDAWLLVRGNDPGSLYCRINRADRIIKDRPMSPEGVAYVIDQRRKLANVSKFTLHDLRRKLIGDLLSLNVDVVTVAELAGHDNPATTQKYDRRGKKVKIDAFERLANSKHNDARY